MNHLIRLARQAALYSGKSYAIVLSDGSHHVVPESYLSGSDFGEVVCIVRPDGSCTKN